MIAPTTNHCQVSTTVPAPGARRFTTDAAQCSAISPVRSARSKNAAPRQSASWFSYRSYFVWVKDIAPQGELLSNGRSARVLVEVGLAGTGYWNRDRDELCLIGVRGAVPEPAMGTQGESVIFAARGEHSEKPAEIYEWAEAHYPSLAKIELNARSGRAGWDCWGNEAPTDDVNPGVQDDGGGG